MLTEIAILQKAKEEHDRVCDCVKWNPKYVKNCPKFIQAILNSSPGKMN